MFPDFYVHAPEFIGVCLNFMSCCLLAQRDGVITQKIIVAGRIAG
jgi:hypothetical protein